MFRISLEVKDSRHLLEREKRYSVLVNGKEFDELYFNMKGYRGSLPTPHGGRLDIGERGLSAWKKVAADLNREAREIAVRMTGDERRFSSIRPTIDGDVVQVTFHDASREALDVYAPRHVAHAGLELLGYDGMRPSYFDEADLCDPLPAPESERICGWSDNVGNTRFVMDVFDSSDPAWKVVAVGFVPSTTLKRVQDPGVDPSWDIGDLKAMYGADWGAGVERLVFIDSDCLEDLISRHGRSFMKADHLPGKGLFSSRPEIFTPVITSSRQRPEAMMSDVDVELYADAIRTSAIRTSPETVTPEI